MQVGAISFQPYIYNTNALSARSLSRIESIGDDLLTSKTDYSSLTDESLNENPLRKGQTANFVDVLGRQMQMSRMNAARVMKPAEEPAALQATASAEPAAALQKADTAQQGQGAQADSNLYQMQRAAQAYQMYMTA